MITLADLQKTLAEYDAKFSRPDQIPQAWDCNPLTYQNLLSTLAPQQRINQYTDPMMPAYAHVAGVDIHPDPEVPVGVFYPCSHPKEIK